MTRYKAGKAQKKALKKDRERAQDKDSSGGGGGGKKKCSPSRRSAVPPEWRELCLRCGAKGHMASACSKRREDINCDYCGRQGHMSKVCLTSYEERHLSLPKKRDKTPFPSVRVTKEASQAVCPDFFRQNAQDIAQNAQKNAPALNVNFFCIFGCFLDVSGWLYFLKNFTFFSKNKLNFTT